MLINCLNCGRANDTSKGVVYCLECGRNLPVAEDDAGAEGALPVPAEPGRGPEALREATREASRLLLVAGALLLLFGTANFAAITPERPAPEAGDNPNFVFVQKEQEKWELEQRQRQVDLSMSSAAVALGLAVSIVGFLTRSRPFQGTLVGMLLLALAFTGQVTLLLAGVDSLVFGLGKCGILLYFLSMLVRACLRVSEAQQPA